MTDDVQRLLVSLEANVRNFERRMDQAARKADQTSDRLENRFKRAGQNVQRAFSGMSRGAVTALGAIGVSISAVAVTQLVNDSLAAAEAIGDMAERAGVGAEFLQELRFAASQNGAEVRDFDDAISRLNRRLGLFQEFLRTGTGEAGPAANAIRALGLETRVASGEIENAEQLFNEAVRALESVEGQSRRSALASQLFGEDSGPRLVQLLDLGIDGLARYRQEARELGVVMDEELRQKAAAASDALERMRMIISTSQAEAVADHVEGLEQLAQAYADITQWALRAAGGIGDFIGAVRSWNDDDASPQQLAMRNNRQQAMATGARIARLTRRMNNPATYDFRRDELQQEIEALEGNLAVLDERYDQMLMRAEQERSRRLGGNRAVRSEEDAAPSPVPLAQPFESIDHEYGPPVATSDPTRALVDALTNDQELWDALQDKHREAAQGITEAIKEDRGEFARTFGGAMADGAMALADGRFPEYLADRLRQTLYDRLFDVFSRLGALLFDNLSQGGKGGGFLSQAARVAFGGGKSQGGPGYAGRMYRVGEHGPEHIVFPQNGMVLPNAAQMPIQSPRVVERVRTEYVVINEAEGFEGRIQRAAQPVAQNEARREVMRNERSRDSRARRQQTSF